MHSLETTTGIMSCVNLVQYGFNWPLSPCDVENALFARKDKTLDSILSMQSSTGFTKSQEKVHRQRV